LLVNKLFVPCKQQADTTPNKKGYYFLQLFLPCKQQADATVK